MHALIDKLRRARERRVEVGGHSYTVRRPTDAEALRLGGSNYLDLVTRFTVGWDLREMDLVPGGGDTPVDWDADLWAEWVADQPDLWPPLAQAILEAYQDHERARAAAAKN